MKTRFLVLLPALALAGVSASAIAQESDASTLAREVCASCHGPGGRSISSTFPRLAGQQAQYLKAQLKAFHDRTRGDPMAQAYMWGMASQMDDSTIDKLATYYAAQQPARGRAADPKLAQEGRAIFEKGIPAANVPACATCHGKNAAGNGSYPRLASQHAAYLVKQLSLFKTELRAGANAPIMHNISTGMSFEQMAAVSAYLAGL
jgi:cytochrome c553